MSERIFVKDLYSISLSAGEGPKAPRIELHFPAGSPQDARVGLSALTDIAKTVIGDLGTLGYAFEHPLAPSINADGSLPDPQKIRDLSQRLISRSLTPEQVDVLGGSIGASVTVFRGPFASRISLNLQPTEHGKEETFERD